jgi:integrase/recombinase XerD
VIVDTGQHVGEPSLGIDCLAAGTDMSAANRNCRCAAIRSFFKHLVRNDLAHLRQYTRVLAIPSKRTRQRPATYLEADDVRAIIAKPDRRTPVGWRDYTLLLFLYNCGARMSEAADVRWDDFQLVPPRHVRLRGPSSGADHGGRLLAALSGARFYSIAHRRS